jgi:hypothetical protein
MRLKASDLDETGDQRDGLVRKTMSQIVAAATIH